MSQDRVLVYFKNLDGRAYTTDTSRAVAHATMMSFDLSMERPVGKITLAEPHHQQLLVTTYENEELDFRLRLLGMDVEMLYERWWSGINYSIFRVPTLCEARKHIDDPLIVTFDEHADDYCSYLINRAPHSLHPKVIGRISFIVNPTLPDEDAFDFVDNYYEQHPL